MRNSPNYCPCWPTLTPRIPLILYTYAYDIACGAALVQKCTLYTCGKYCGTMNDEYLESKALCKVQQFHECYFSSNRRHAAGKLLVIYISFDLFLSRRLR